MANAWSRWRPFRSRCKTGTGLLDLGVLSPFCNGFLPQPGDPRNRRLPGQGGAQVPAASAGAFPGFPHRNPRRPDQVNPLVYRQETVRKRGQDPYNQGSCPRFRTVSKLWTEEMDPSALPGITYQKLRQKAEE